MSASAGREWTDTATRLRLELDEAVAERDRYRGLVIEADRFLRNGSGYLEEVGDWLGRARAALGGEE